MGRARGGAQRHSYERRPGVATRPLPAAWRRREPEGTVLHAVVREHLRSFLDEARERSAHGTGLPRFVQEEFERYLGCGVLANGFARVRCGDCQHEVLVAFSCKGRGVCPSCNARRMCDTAAHLVDAVLPRAPVRQWVLSLPRWARFLLAKDAALASRVLAIVLRAVFTDYRRRARGAGVEGESQCGAVTFVQRFGDALNLNVHFHCVAPDGVFVRDPDGVVRFSAVRPPDEEELEALLTKVVRRLERVLRPLLEQPDPGDAQASDYAAAVQATLPVDDEPVRKKRLTAFLLGYSLNAATHLHENDREALERLCRYGARPPFALERLAQRPDGQLTYRLRHPRAGRDYLVLAPTELLRKLATLIPPPRHHLTRFHGVLAPNANWRPEVVPAPPAITAQCSTTPPHAEPPAPMLPAATNDAAPAPSRLPWADLLARVYRADVLECSHCGGRMTVLAFITERDTVREILDHLGLPSTGPPLAPARSRPQPEPDAWQGDLAFDDLPAA